MPVAVLFVIGFDWRCWLWVAEFKECGAEGNGFLCIEVEDSDLCFGGGCHYVLDDFGKTVDGANLNFPSRCIQFSPI